jgi:GT2 family glycosyltransferase
MTTPRSQPLVVENRWHTLEVPSLGAWRPTRSVTMVIPAHNATHLPLTLAALAAQTYPEHLLEVVVVDDGSDPPVTLPDVRPQRTRVVTTRTGWGRAAACHSGVEASDGEVVHWLDADMVPERSAVEAQLRWHHLVDYAVVLGHKLFAPADALCHLTSPALYDALAAGTAPEALARGELTPHEWVEDHLAATDDLRTAGPRAMRVHVGASASVGRGLYEDAGGMPADLRLGEDIVLGYRLREAGAVFVPDRESRALHLGPSTVNRMAEAVNRHNRPFFADLMSEYRYLRPGRPRAYAVPYVEAVVPVSGHTYEHIRTAVDHLLGGALPDVAVTLVGDWTALTEERRRVLDDDRLDMRLVRAAYASDPRVRLANRVTERSDAAFRLTLPDPLRFPARRTLRRLLQEVEEQQVGTVRWRQDGYPDVLLTRTCALAREARCIPAPSGPQHSYGALQVDVARMPLARADAPPAPRRPPRKRPPAKRASGPPRRPLPSRPRRLLARLLARTRAARASLTGGGPTSAPSRPTSSAAAGAPRPGREARSRSSADSRSGTVAGRRRPA